ncbi:ParB/RepB/Spo0J family partition protein [Variovorax sp. DAIF25]|uniref:ParB/RepB/Spo0J family partition protein n=1 Tax=Variovorax sp. DAIF25 TaxID=3080983 RepID=UPI003D6B2AD9
MTDQAEIELNPGNVKAAMREAGARSSDLWKVPRKNIRVLPGFNPRTETPAYQAHIKWIGGSILSNGYDQTEPLAGYVVREGEENFIYLTDGHSRLRGVDWAMERGAAIEVLPVLVSPAGTSMADITVGFVTKNSGRPLTPLEKSTVCKRLIGYGLEEEQIAERLGFTRSYVASLLILAGASMAIKAMVASNEISASNAISAIRAHGAGAAAHLSGRIEEAKSKGKTKVTRKSLAPAPRDLVAEGVAWIEANKEADDSLDEKVAGLLSHLTGVPLADIAARFAESPAA